VTTEEFWQLNYIYKIIHKLLLNDHVKYHQLISKMKYEEKNETSI